MAEIRFVWWNLQNFFDTDDDPISKDFEYTPAKGWTDQVFQAKKSNLANALNATHSGSGPELLAVAEIETDDLLEELITEMGNPHLEVVEDPSGTSDLRGIDVAMAYDKQRLRPKCQASHVVHLRYRTRDIFEVVFEVIGTDEELVVIASHWPSRMLGKYRTEPLRCAVAEHIAYLVESHVKVEPEKYEELRDEDDDLEPVMEKWEAKVMVVGDFNDEPGERSVVDHLKASNELDRVIGATNDIDGFKDETADYRGQDVFLFNPTWKFLPQQNTGTYFLDTLRSGEKLAKRYQILDQLVASRGLVSGNGLTLDINSVSIFRDSIVATSSGRPRKFKKNTMQGTSDHLPLTAVLNY
jgi:endonuclease/exonuclease/phosphatase family metal-dependent hydrolase